MYLLCLSSREITGTILINCCIWMCFFLSSRMILSSTETAWNSSATREQRLMGFNDYLISLNWIHLQYTIESNVPSSVFFLHYEYFIESEFKILNKRISTCNPNVVILTSSWLCSKSFKTLVWFNVIILAVYTYTYQTMIT